MNEWMDKNLIFDRRTEQPMTIATLILAMERDGVKLVGTERAQMMRVAAALSSRGARKDHTRNGSIWLGVGRAPRS